MQLQPTLIKITNFLLNLLFPLECLKCGQEDRVICSACLKEIPLCNLSKSLSKIDDIQATYSATDYHLPIMQKMIHYYKFRFVKSLAEPLAELLIIFIQKHKIFADLTEPLVVPVPLHKKRYLERGFNQSALIGKILAENLGFDFDETAVIRSKNTGHQVGLAKTDRQINIKNCFQVIKPDLIKNRQIILIDDVITTGSTLKELALSLKKSGATEIYAITLAKD